MVSASRSQAASSAIRLSASRSARNSASDKSVRLTAGTSARPSCRAARTSPQPATTRNSGSIRIGKTKPNRSRLAASLCTCCGGCLRVSRPSDFKLAIETSVGSTPDVARPLPVLLHFIRAPMAPSSCRWDAKNAGLLERVCLCRYLSFVGICREFNSRQIPTRRPCAPFGQYRGRSHIFR